MQKRIQKLKEEQGHLSKKDLKEKPYNLNIVGWFWEEIKEVATYSRFDVFKNWGNLVIKCYNILK